MDHGKNFDSGRRDLIGDNERELCHDQFAGVSNASQSAYQRGVGKLHGFPADGRNNTIGGWRIFLPDMGVNLGQVQLGVFAPADFHNAASPLAAKKASISSSGTKSDRRAASIFSRHQS